VIRIHHARAAALLFSLLLAVPSPALAQRERVATEALALHALTKDKDRPISLESICRRLKNASSLELQELWKRLCEPNPPIAGIRSCMAGYFECLKKEGMAGSKMPEGGSFDCDARTRSCKLPASMPKKQ
jgi:hypothetical protein